MSTKAQLIEIKRAQIQQIISDLYATDAAFEDKLHPQAKGPDAIDQRDAYRKLYTGLLTREIAQLDALKQS